jgi:hypothetical protein
MGLAQENVSKVGPVFAELKGSIIKHGNDAFKYARRKSVEVAEAIRTLPE